MPYSHVNFSITINGRELTLDTIDDVPYIPQLLDALVDYVASHYPMIGSVSINPVANTDRPRGLLMFGHVGPHVRTFAPLDLRMRQTRIRIEFSDVQQQTHNVRAAPSIGDITIPRNYVNAISHETFEEGEDAVRLHGDDRYVFKMDAIQEWFKQRRINPLTQQHVYSTNIERGKIKFKGGSRRRGSHGSRRGRK